MAYTVSAEIKALNEKIAALEAEARKPDYSRVRQVDGVPYVTKGAIGNDSQGFSLCKALAWQMGFLSAEKAKVEIDAVEHFHKALDATPGYGDSTNRTNSTVTILLSESLLPHATRENKSYKHFKSLWDAGIGEADLDEIRWMANRSQVMRKAAMSYLADATGGTWVAPPVQGDFIELMRPNEALLNAGASVVPLPVNGRITFPRQTSPTSAYWVGENTEITESNPGTGQISMQARKAGVLVTVPNELLKYASVAADAMIRTDTAKTLALALDYAGLYGTGSSAQPKGLVNYTDTNQVIDYMGLTPAPKGVGTNGNTLRPEDGYRMIGLLEDRNFQFNGWIFRPTMANNISGYRGDAVTAGDANANFVQSMMRMIGDRMPGTEWCGYKITKSATVRANQTKGSSGATLTEVFGGQWEHLMIGMYGAVEFASSNQAGNTFKQDQTQIRALMACDVVPRYEGAFVWAKLLLNQMN